MEFVRLRAHQYQKFDGSVVQNAKKQNSFCHRCAMPPPSMREVFPCGKAPSLRELAAKQTEGVPVPKAEADILPSQQQEAKPVAQPQPAPLQESSEKNVLLSLGVPEKLAALMSANKVSCEELQGVVGKRGYFPEDMPIKDYPADFVEGCLIAAWPQVFQMVLDNRDIPF